jgi:dUTP pyrophosphatase
MKVKIKKLHPHAVIPQYANFGDAGLDLTATSMSLDDLNLIYGTGLAIEIPQGYVGLLFPRSSISKKSLFQRNAVGVIDSGYRGEIMIKFGYYKKDYNAPYQAEKAYQVGERIGQLIIVPYPQIELVESDTLSESDRGTGGFGSSGA